MRLYGYQCDHCGMKSKDIPGDQGNWIEIKPMRVRGEETSFMGTHLMSDGRHYCSSSCLKEAIDTWPKR